MIPQKAILITFSPTRTTHTIVESIGEGLGLPVTTLDMTEKNNRSQQHAFAETDMLVIGFPVYAGRLPRIQEQIFSLLGKGRNFVVPVVVYGNRAYEDALLELATLCRGKGYKPVGAAAFIGEHSYAKELATKRPDANDKREAAAFGKKIMECIRQEKFLGRKGIPGNTPFKDLPPKAPIVPETTEACTECMQCADNCPTQAISHTNPREIEAYECILCAACIKICPEEAKKITFAPFLQRIEGIVAANREPKKPEVFLPE